MKSGDLVKMKYAMFWMLKGHKEKYTEEVALVISAHHNAIKIMTPDGTIKSDLAEHWRVISESP